VAADGRVQAYRDVAGRDVIVRMTQARGDHLHHDLALAGLVHIELDGLELSGSGEQGGCACFHRGVPAVSATVGGLAELDDQRHGAPSSDGR
jgi:hypothetical protein